MTEEVLQACRDMRILGWVWFGLMIGAGSLAISYAALYQFGVRVRMPRLRAAVKRIARERDQAKAEAIRVGVECETLRRAMHTVGIEAEKEIRVADARVDRERAIRKKTEDRLAAQNLELDDARSQAQALEGLLLSVNSHMTVEPGSPGSWVPSQIGADSATK